MTDPPVDDSLPVQEKQANSNLCCVKPEKQKMFTDMILNSTSLLLLKTAANTNDCVHVIQFWILQFLFFADVGCVQWGSSHCLWLLEFPHSLDVIHEVSSVDVFHDKV